MAEQTTTGDLSGITITTGESYVKDVATSVPIASNLYKIYKEGQAAVQDQSISPGEMASMGAEMQDFVQSCLNEMTAFLQDPLGWLVSQGLSFLINVFQPLEDFLNLCIGNHEALAQAAGNFAAIGKGIHRMRQEFEQNLMSTLQEWGGQAAEAAGSELADFASGIDGIAGQAGDISQLLQGSSMVMKAIKDFIMAVISEFVIWLIGIWIPALMAAGPTFGASTAAASSATAARAASTTATTARQVSRLQRLLDKLRDLLDRLKAAMRATRKRVADVQQGNTSTASSGKWTQMKFGGQETRLDGSVSRRLRDPATGQELHFGHSLANATQQAAAQQVSLGTAKGIGNAYQADQIGTEQSMAETKSQLDVDEDGSQQQR